MNVRFLVLGACGMAGHVIAKYLSEVGEDVVGMTRRESPVCRTVLGDALDPEFTRRIIVGQGFDVVVNCIGVLNQNVDKDTSRGIFINSYFPHLIRDYCNECGARLVHISTDCVFSGRVGNYREQDVPDGTSLYARSKCLGEIFERPHLTIRTSIVGPELKSDGIGLFHWFMTQKKSVNGFSNVFWSGVTTIELAKAVRAAAKQNLCGLYHLTNNKKISKYKLLTMFNKYCRKNPIVVVEQSMPKSDKSLLCTRQDFGYRIPEYEDMVKEVGAWIGHHRELYAQYEEKTI